jgi:membrane protease YdiL (CAAX protease family)
MDQSEIVKKMSDSELNKQILFSQLLLFIISVVASFFLFDSMSDWKSHLVWNIKDIYYYGILTGCVIVALDLLLMFIFPKKYYDDGGINARIFKNKPVVYIFVIALVVAICEELLFRGVMQSVFGYIFASVIFALVHVRYLKKPVLFISVLFVSFYIGYMFKITGNLFVTIAAHFTVDFILGLVIRFQR